MSDDPRFSGETGDPRRDLSERSEASPSASSSGADQPSGLPAAPAEPDVALDVAFDARQWAMHGLLRAYYDQLERDDDARTRDVLRRIGLTAEADTRAAAEVGAAAPAAGDDQLPSPSSSEGSRKGELGRIARRSRVRRATRRTLGRIWLWAGSGAAAAAILLGFVLYFGSLGPAPAVADTWRDAALAYVLQPLAPFIFLDSTPEERADTEYKISVDLALRDELRAQVEADRTLDTVTANDLYHAWSRAYRGLAGIGRWDEAFAEAYGLIDHATRFHRTSTVSPWPYIGLSDVANIYAALGDIPLARQAQLLSLELREQYAACSPTPTIVLQTRFVSVTPTQLALADLALADGDLDGTASWLAQAEDLSRAYYAAICHAAGVNPPPEATALTLYEQYVPQEFREPPPLFYSGPVFGEITARYHGFAPGGSGVVLLEALGYRQARLLRVRGELPAAEALLARVLRMPDYPAHDDERVAFHKRLEAARLAIAQDQWARARDHLREAAEATGAVIVTEPGFENLSKPAICGFARLELDFLTAVVELKLADIGASESGMTPSTSSWPTESSTSDASRRLATILIRLDDLIQSTPLANRPALRQRFAAWHLPNNGTG